MLGRKKFSLSFKILLASLKNLIDIRQVNRVKPNKSLIMYYELSTEIWDIPKTGKQNIWRGVGAWGYKGEEGHSQEEEEMF